MTLRVLARLAALGVVLGGDRRRQGGRASDHRAGVCARPRRHRSRPGGWRATRASPPPAGSSQSAGRRLVARRPPSGSGRAETNSSEPSGRNAGAGLALGAAGQPPRRALAVRVDLPQRGDVHLCASGPAPPPRPPAGARPATAPARRAGAARCSRRGRGTRSARSSPLAITRRRRAGRGRGERERAARPASIALYAASSASPSRSAARSQAARLAVVRARPLDRRGPARAAASGPRRSPQSSPPPNCWSASRSGAQVRPRQPKKCRLQHASSPLHQRHAEERVERHRGEQQHQPQRVAGPVRPGVDADQHPGEQVARRAGSARCISSCPTCVVSDSSNRSV